MVAKLLPLLPVGGNPYCEPYCGAASLFWNRDPAPVEVLNDLNGDLVNLFRCLQDRAAFDDLKHRLTWTLWSRAEFARAIDILKSGETDAVTRAWAFFVAQNQGFSCQHSSAGNWSRVFVSTGGMADTTNRWIMRLAMLDAWRLRIQRVQIDNRCALGVIRYWDTPDTVFYCDPPYVSATRVSGYRDAYRHECDDAHHAELVSVLLGAEGAVVLSGYDHPIYAPLDAAGWDRVEFKTACHAAGRVRGSGLQGAGAALAKVPRTEVLWRNPKAVAMSP